MPLSMVQQNEQVQRRVPKREIMMPYKVLSKGCTYTTQKLSTSGGTILMQPANFPAPVMSKPGQSLGFLRGRSIYFWVYLEFNCSFRKVLFATTSAGNLLSLRDL